MLNKHTLRYLLAFVTSSIVFPGVVFATDTNNSKPLTTIPFKSENTAVDDAASSMPYVFLILIMLGVVIYFLNKKIGYFNTLNFDKKEQSNITVMQIKKITPDTMCFKLKVDDAEYIFLESKNTLTELHKDNSSPE